MPRTAGSLGDKTWRDTLRKLSREVQLDPADGKRRRRLETMGRALFLKADEGDVTAIKEIGDRLDGKPAQAVDVALAVAITTIERRIIDPIELIAESVVVKAIEHDDDA